MLYDQKFDTFNPTTSSKINIEKHKQDLTNAYRDLGALDQKVSKKIERQFHALSLSLDKLSSRKQHESILITIEDLNMILPLPLLKRTQQITKFSLDAEKKKKEIFAPITNFLEILKEFMSDKVISISNSGQLTICKEDRTIPIDDLSSGEKQLLILLIETLLQKSEPFIFFADEPELSLHIAWQSKVISSIQRLNPHSQVVVATHSPEIAGGWNGKLIQMEDVVHE